MSDEYARIFCTAEKPPTIKEILLVLRTEGTYLEVAPITKTDLDSHNWDRVFFIYEEGKLPISVELIIPPEYKNQWGLEDFIEAIKDTKKASQSRKKVLQLLEAINFYIAIPLSPNMDESELRVIGAFLSCFARNWGGIVQTDEEGFLEGKKILLQIQWKS